MSGILLLMLGSGPTVIEDLGLRDDAAPDRRLPVRVTLPQGKGPFPVLVWSHARGLDKNAYDPLVRPLAERGYAVFQPTHRDSLVYASPDQKAALMPGEGVASNWGDRARQTALVVDRLGALNQSHPELKGKLDLARIAVGGHGHGADTAQLLAGVRAGTSYESKSVLAFVWMSAQGVPVLEGNEVYAGVTRPVLMISGGKDVVARTRRSAAWRRSVFEALPAGGKHLLWLENGTPNFGGVSGRTLLGGGPEDPAQVATSLAAIHVFLEAYVRGNGSARAALLANEVRLAAPATFTHRP